MIMYFFLQDLYSSRSEGPILEKGVAPSISTMCISVGSESSLLDSSKSELNMIGQCGGHSSDSGLRCGEGKCFTQLT